MGGRGSGRHGGLGPTVGLCHRSHSIDLDWLRRRKLLNQGQWSTLTWSVGETKTGSIQIALMGARVMLSYRVRRAGADWQDVKEAVPLIETSTNFSGRRHWFECLSCRRRCRILYGGAVFRCRKCQGLRYETQYEPPFARAATRALKIRERLGCKGGIDDPFPAKPKGMHFRTYEGLRAEAERQERRWEAGITGVYRFLGAQD